MRPLLTLTIAAAIAGSAAGAPASAQTRPADAATCVVLFKQFDVLQNLYPNNKARYDGRVAQPPVETQAQRVRNAGCITLTRELVGMETVAAPPVSNAGPAIAPTQLHAGVVTNMADDARARAFFASKGVLARSVGSAPLGRRIYIGPFATQGALDEARGAGARRRLRLALSGDLLMRALALIAGLAALSAGPADAATPWRDPATCLATFDAYDTAAWLYPNNRFRSQPDPPAIGTEPADAAAAPAGLPDALERHRRHAGARSRGSRRTGSPTAARRSAPPPYMSASS